MRYWTAGAGPPLVLVHGLAGSRRWWAAALAELAARHCVYLVDLPGFGAMRRQALALEELPAWLRAWLAAVGVDRADLIGHSMGGLVCARVAARYPDAVGRLVLVAPVGVPSGRSNVRYAVPLARTAARQSPRFLATLAADTVRCGPRAVWRAGREIALVDARDELRSIRAPTLLVWGERDRLVPPSSAEAFLEAIPDSRLALLPRVGHVPMVERPAGFVQALRHFLDERDD